MPRWLKCVLLGMPAFFLLIQLYRPARTNPSVDPTRTIMAQIDVPMKIDVVLRCAAASR
ncbi:MAG: hypothetical protein ACE5HV_03175 [Acidobacteriota bacterium]